MLILNDQGGGVMSVTEDVVNTLRAQNHGHPPLVLSLWAILYSLWIQATAGIKSAWHGIRKRDCSKPYRRNKSGSVD